MAGPPGSKAIKELVVPATALKSTENNPEGPLDNASALEGTYESKQNGENNERATETRNGEEDVMTPAKVKTRKWYKNLNPLRWGSIPQVPEERIVSREYKAGFLSRLTFQWMTPLMTTGYKRQLEKGDIWTVNPDRAVEPLTHKVRLSFLRHVRNGQKHPLLWALYESFRFEFMLGGFCAFIGTVLRVMSAFTLRFLIQFAAEAYRANALGHPPPPISYGFGLAVGITMMLVVQSVCINHFTYHGLLVGGQSRGVLTGMIYEKAMVISARAKAGSPKVEQMPESDDEQDIIKAKRASKKKPGKNKREEQQRDGTGWANGRIINLISVDAHRIDKAAGLLHIAWTSPFACILTLIVLLINLGYCALPGFGLLVVGIPVLAWAARSLFHRRKKINKITDQRVSLTREIIQSIRTVKYFGWEQAFMNQLDMIRSKEVSAIQALHAIRNAINAANIVLPLFASMLSFIAYSLSNHFLAPSRIFSALALFNALRVPLNLLPLVLNLVTDAWLSLKRIEEFLMEEEQDENVIYTPDAQHAVELRNASFTWEITQKRETNEGTFTGINTNGNQATIPQLQDAGTSPGSYDDDNASTLVEEREPFKLQELSLKADRNELIAIIGTVGSGKSSLLAALAGDMRKTSGDVMFSASRAFCPQYPWLQNTTVQNNITFGKELDKWWYDEVIQACALQADLDMLPNGDQTEVGERGITLSGGQKQRLNIARAIYSNADIVILDDPLSAVDAHVGRHIFDNAILGILRNKCRILATHQLWVLSRCDRIIWMEEGKIQADDTFDNLMRNYNDFRVLMRTATGEDENREGNGTTRVDTGEKKSTKKPMNGAAPMKREERTESTSAWSVYGAYTRASGSILNGPLIIFTLLITQGAKIMTILWLSFWTANRFGLLTGQYIGIYASLGAAQAVLVLLFSEILSILGTNASKVIFRNAFTRILYAPISFFDTTPLGHITNRFSSDVDVMDNNLTGALRIFFFTAAMITSVFALIIAFFHYFAIVLVPLYLVFVGAALYYRASARELKRIESTLRSHLVAKFSEGLSGVACIRAYGLTRQFIKDLRTSIDEMNSAYYLTFSNQRWLSIRLDMIANALVLTVGILVVTSRLSVHPSISGLVLSYILVIVQILQFATRQLAEVENGMHSVERIHYFGTQLTGKEEAPQHTIEVRKTWPEKGEIVFNNVQLRYRENLPLVLRGLSIHIRGGERIGIIGRTGAGKSSIISTLFRLVEISSGSITIDGLNIHTIGLHDLRSRLAIIPQDVALFHGTVRSNLDPFNEYTDMELWSALHQANLAPATTSTGNSAGDELPHNYLRLDSPVEEEGANFSLGQRQLMAFARALVRDSKIIACDEATSSVDMETDEKIQRTMATAFHGRTLLCVAHRLRTVIGYDRICVMDAGEVAELDTPFELWSRGGIFRSMCDQSGISFEDIQSAVHHHQPTRIY